MLGVTNTNVPTVRHWLTALFGDADVFKDLRQRADYAER
jgi:hypothetical protein